MNTGFALHQHVKGTAGDVYMSDVKLKIAHCRSRVGWANFSIVYPRGTVETVGKQKDACPSYETGILVLNTLSKNPKSAR